MAFTTYANTRNPHVTIHRDGCNQMRKHGGDHKYSEGCYQSHASLEKAREHARRTNLPVKECSFCKPG